MNNQSQYKIIIGQEQFTLFTEISRLRKEVWPDFIRLADETIFKIYHLYPDFQISLLNQNNELIGIANSIPLIWNQSVLKLSNDGVSWVINTGLNQKYEADLANVLCAISITVAEKYRDMGVSKLLLRILKQIAFNTKMSSLVVPVRPNLKYLYPLISIDDYIGWKNKKGLIFDPWIRTHIALGAKILNVCYQSAFITGSIKEWEDWTGMIFPQNGQYVIKNALAPIQIEYEHDRGIYIEPNVWVYYLI